MIIRLSKLEVKILVDKNPVKISFEEWARPGHFSRTIAKGPDTTTWIWNLHADAHDFDSHTSVLEEISCKIFSAHFGQLSIIFLWLSGMYFHGARFSNYEAWLSDPTHIGPSAQVNGCTRKIGKSVIQAVDSAGLHIVPVSFDNAELYGKVGVPFVMGTTVGDRDRLYRTVEESKVVAFLAAMEIMAEQFPGAFSGYNLQIQMIRDPKQQIEMMGVVEEHLSGHACHLLLG
ncbi:hypothetical protein GOBAR_DD27903 [Gossypium barbadense]|nr:hypothetical protein GOBAR_DD27903 [Gossypium barbadense]